MHVANDGTGWIRILEFARTGEFIPGTDEESDEVRFGGEFMLGEPGPIRPSDRIDAPET